MRKMNHWCILIFIAVQVAIRETIASLQYFIHIQFSCILAALHFPTLARSKVEVESDGYPDISNSFRLLSGKQLLIHCIFVHITIAMYFGSSSLSNASEFRGRSRIGGVSWCFKLAQVANRETFANSLYFPSHFNFHVSWQLCTFQR